MPRSQSPSPSSKLIPETVNPGNNGTNGPYPKPLDRVRSALESSIISSPPLDFRFNQLPHSANYAFVCATIEKIPRRFIVANVSDSVENAAKCRCNSCLTYRATPCPAEQGEGLYCARGKTSCPLPAKGCRCGGCPVAGASHLGGGFFCIKGVES